MNQKEIDKKFMAVALEEAYYGSQNLEGGPFGCCIVSNAQIVARAHNRVLKDKDPTAHAEVNAIRKASQTLNRYDLSDCSIYTTTEPCPMCFSAIHWARIPLIIYGTEISEAKVLGFNELAINTEKLKSLSDSKVELVGKFMHQECRELFDFWSNLSQSHTY